MYAHLKIGEFCDKYGEREKNGRSNMGPALLFPTGGELFLLPFD